MSGVLYIIATPIGNLEDITFRAVRTLKEVDLIAAEDTRHSRKLLSHFGIGTKLTAYHDHNERLKSDHLLSQLREGKNLALITDAGTPCIADPGYRIAQAAVAAGIRVVPIPGPSAVMAALSAAGLPTDRFAFEGFLPPRQGKRRAHLAELAAEERVMLFYEAPHRLAATLADMLAVLGNRQVVVARELTKIHEEFRRGTVAELIEWCAAQEPRGEVVILVTPAEVGEAPVQDLGTLLARHLVDEGFSVKEAVARVTAETGLPRREVYAAALKIKTAQG
ncbi:16S rRNA (cytidine(1402)-2'-O)-methyltransferase [Geobacter argillaceus]|uniref:Ribosomal RNA small subunit methyltransferase I n=1 Tax=Geobacter argillaceus TaxID=345631 RepID=A0A562WRS2_9BACT|nr:16S rRNA (cytidine(1402)-2'-O)-methyltransferase [Geobacter argillaceus]TWJ32905.1 16S rRNA (cytidine1402-2'-O)-methyltransferase [Geobacter argillaceus]